jgi:hypothetical protein
MEFLKKNPALDNYHYHEVVDRCHIIMCMIQDHLLDHPAIIAHPDEEQKLNQAVTILWEVYQRFGSASSESIDISGHAV